MTEGLIDRQVAQGNDTATDAYDDAAMAEPA
jgi:hypothetical protein